MCNLYSVTRSQDEIRRLFRVERDRTGNMPPLPGIFPDELAPVIRVAGDGVREMELMRWGFPALDKPGARPVTNTRNAASSYWRAWLRPELRCVVPATSFCEYDEQNAKRPTWFALGRERPLFGLAGLWRPWTGVRGKEHREHLLFSFLTCDANDLVRPVHAKAMPVLLTTPEEWDVWLSAPAEEALALQRPLAADRLEIVLTGARKDSATELVPA